MKEAVKELRRGYDNFAQQNYAEGRKNMVRATSLMEISGLTMDKVAATLALGGKGYETQIHEEDYALAFKDVPQRKSSFMGIPMPFTTQDNIPEVRRNQYRVQQQLNNTGQ